MTGPLRLSFDPDATCSLVLRLRTCQSPVKLGKQAEHGEVDEAFLRSLNSFASIWLHYSGVVSDRDVRGSVAASKGEAPVTAPVFGLPRTA